MGSGGNLHRGLGEIDPDAPIGTSLNPSHRLLTIPNIITLLRLVFTVLFLVLYPTEQFHVMAICLFIVAACTDWIDGKLARRLQQVSWIGKRFDPVMDRILIFSGLLALVFTSRVPVWIVVFLVARDVLLFLGGFLTLKKSNRLPDVCYIGKACTFVLMAGFAVLLLDLAPVPGLGLVDSEAFPGLGTSSTSIGTWLVYLGCVLSFVAATIYTVRGVRILRSNAGGGCKDGV